LAGRDLDWQRFLRLTQHHRIIPVVAHNFCMSLPDPQPPAIQTTAAELRRLAAINTHQALRLLAELRRVVTSIEAQNTPVRVLKGLPLAQAVFGDLGLRAPGDIDLLVDPAHVRDADSALRNLGYTPLYRLDRFTPRQYGFYVHHWKDMAYENPEIGTAVDLHWRCFRNPAAPGGHLCETPAHNTVSFGNFYVDTLPDTQGLLYLCVHGTLDGWVYLKSLVDVAAQFRSMDEHELEETAHLAERYGILPELTATLLLVRRYFGLNYWTSNLLPEADRTVSHILRYADEALLQREFLATRDDIRIGRTIAFEFGLRRSHRYRSELLLRILFRARMWETMPLPDWLFWAYPLLSPLEWLLFRLRPKRSQG
jgi:hypothetical protein